MSYSSWVSPTETTVTFSSFDDNDDICLICKSHVDIKKTYITIGKDDYNKYHKHCFDKWLKKSRKNPKDGSIIQIYKIHYEDIFNESLRNTYTRKDASIKK